MALARSSEVVALRLGLPALAAAASKAPQASLSTSRWAAKIKGEELLGEDIDVQTAFPHEEHKPAGEGGRPIEVNLEAEHDRVEDPEIPALSSLFESHAVHEEQSMGGEEAAREVERLRQAVPPVKEDF